MKIKGAIIILLILTTSFARSQTIYLPNYSLKSHETLGITKVETRPDAVVFHLKIENRINGGTFCADRNIYILYPGGKKSRLVLSSGIPVCPQTHGFKTIGEILEFVLVFPPLDPGTAWVDLIEECRDNCFYFYGVVLDEELNSRINEAFALADSRQYREAMNSFEAILSEAAKKTAGISGLLYINLVRLAIEAGEDDKASEWYGRLRLSGIPRLTSYLKYLNDQGIRY